MSDDAWRRQGRDEDEDFGPAVRRRADHRGEAGRLVLRRRRHGLVAALDRAADGGGADTSARRRRTPIRARTSTSWSSFSSQSPVWSDDDPSGTIDPSGGVPAAAVPPPPPLIRPGASRGATTPSGTRPSRCAASPDGSPSAPTPPIPPDARCPVAVVRTRRAAVAQGLVRHRRVPGSRVGAPPAGRDMPTAIAVGVAIGRGVRRRPAVAAGGGTGDRRHRPRARLGRVLRQGHREGVPAGHDRRDRRDDRDAARRLLGG